MPHDEKKSAETFLPADRVHPELLQAVKRLQALQTEYAKAAALLREKYGIHNRGCGPGSFCLAVLLQENFREQGVELPLDASLVHTPQRSEGIHIMFGTEREGLHWIDHAWLEILYKDQILVVSHESEAHSARTSFRAAAAQSEHLASLYEVFGFRLAKNLDDLQQQANVSAENMSAIVQIFKTINAGEIPENYAEYTALLLEHIREADWHRESTSPKDA
jgi:hypothetical protein